MAIAIRMPRIAITIISSIRVKPCWIFFMVSPLGGIWDFHVPGEAGFPVRRQPCIGARASRAYAEFVPLHPDSACVSPIAMAVTINGREGCQKTDAMGQFPGRSDKNCQSIPSFLSLYRRARNVILSWAAALVLLKRLASSA